MSQSGEPADLPIARSGVAHEISFAHLPLAPDHELMFSFADKEEPLVLRPFNHPHCDHPDDEEGRDGCCWI